MTNLNQYIEMLQEKGEGSFKYFKGLEYKQIANIIQFKV